jgi:hypothetical protein
MDPATRIPFEMLYAVLLPVVGLARSADPSLYRALLSAVVQLAAVLGKECPVQNREHRRQARGVVVE